MYFLIQLSPPTLRLNFGGVHCHSNSISDFWHTERTYLSKDKQNYHVQKEHKVHFLPNWNQAGEGGGIGIGHDSYRISSYHVQVLISILSLSCLKYE